MRPQVHIWMFAVGLSIALHAVTFAALSFFGRNTSPQLLLPQGDSSAASQAIRVILLPMQAAASPHPPVEYEATQDVLEAIGLAADLEQLEEQSPPVAESGPTIIEDAASSAAAMLERSKIQSQWRQRLQAAEQRARDLSKLIRRASATIIQTLAFERTRERMLPAATPQHQTAPVEFSGNAEPASGPDLGVASAPIASSTNKPPKYPREALQRRQSGTVLLHLLIESDGRVAGASVLESSGIEALDAAALDAARSWRFQPAVQNGTAARCGVNIPVDFVLK